MKLTNAGGFSAPLKSRIDHFDPCIAGCIVLRSLAEMRNETRNVPPPPAPAPPPASAGVADIDPSLFSLLSLRTCWVLARFACRAPMVVPCMCGLSGAFLEGARGDVSPINSALSSRIPRPLVGPEGSYTRSHLLLSASPLADGVSTRREARAREISLRVISDVTQLASYKPSCSESDARGVNVSLTLLHEGRHTRSLAIDRYLRVSDHYKCNGPLSNSDDSGHPRTSSECGPFRSPSPPFN